MALPSDVIKELSLLFQEVTKGKYKLVVVDSENEQEYLLDLSEAPTNTFDKMVFKALLVCLSHAIRPKKSIAQLPQKTQNATSAEETEDFSPYSNSILWDMYSKKRQ